MQLDPESVIITLADLDPAAIEDFRRRWREETGNDALASASSEQLLEDADLITSEGVTYAALILLGQAKSLGRFLAQAEVVFEYRSSEAPGPANQRDDYRRGFLTFFDKLWQTINLRNDNQHYQEGFVMHHIDTFREGSVREAILNAISHRDYRHPGSVFVRQYPRRLEVVSPGGLPTGITPDNIIDKQFPRNRRIAAPLWPRRTIGPRSKPDVGRIRPRQQIVAGLLALRRA